MNKRNASRGRVPKRLCVTCKRLRPVDDFRVDRFGDGKNITIFHQQCKECENNRRDEKSNE